MKAIVYADMLFLINFIINMILLKVMCIFVKYSSKLFRMSIAACIGSIYAVCMFFPNLKLFYIFPFKMLVSVIMIIIAIPKCTIVKLIKSCAVFYLTSFSFAGIMLALIYLSNISDTYVPFVKDGIFYFDISIFTLIVSSLIVYALLWLASSVFAKSKMMGIRKLKIELGQRECVLSALCDTGNLLTDPISQMPVIIADKKSIMPLFPSGIPDITNGCIDGARVRVIPYSSLGAKDAMMTGFVPDRVELDGKSACGVVVGISEDALSETDEYNALFNPNILN